MTSDNGCVLGPDLDVLDVALDGVEAGVLQALGAAGAAFVDEDEAVSAGQRQQPGQEVVVAGAGTAMQDDQRRAVAEGLVVDEHAVGVDEALLLGVDGGLGGGRDRHGSGKNQREKQAQGLHDDENTSSRTGSDLSFYLRI